jgi:hypothetical protein
MARKPESRRPRPLNIVLSKRDRGQGPSRAPAVAPAGRARPGMIVPGLPPTPDHDLQFHGGKTLPHLTFTNMYAGGPQAWDPADIQNIDAKLAAAMSDVDMNNVMMQYFSNQTITSTFAPSRVLPGSRPDTFSQVDVEALMAQLYAQGAVRGFDLSTTVLNLMLPSRTVLTIDGLSSLQGLAGFHGSIHPSTGVTVYYAVGVFSEVLPDGTTNGIVAFDAPWKSVVATFYHELNEARTDADVEDAINAGNDPTADHFLGWVSPQGEECGDFPITEVEPDLGRVLQEVPLTNGTGTAPVQFQYSNAVHGPEGPILTPHTAARTQRR